MRASLLALSLLLASTGCGTLVGLEDSPLKPQASGAGSGGRAGEAGAAGVSGSSGQSGAGGADAGTGGAGGAGQAGQAGAAGDGGAAGDAGAGGEAGQGGAGQGGAGQGGAGQGGAGQGGAGQGGAGQGGGGAAGGGLTLEQVEFPGVPGGEVAQGTSGVEVQLVGAGFTAALGVSLGGVQAKSVAVSDDKNAKAVFDIPHGATLQAVTVEVSQGGESAQLGTLQITAIHAGGPGASDDTGLGTPGKPYLTLKPAVGHAAAGDTVVVVGSVAAGTNALAIPGDVMLRSGDAGDGEIDGGGLKDGLLLGPGVKLQGLTIKNFVGDCLQTAPSGQLQIIDTRVRGCGATALKIEGAPKVELTGTTSADCVFETSARGIDVAAAAQVTIAQCTVRENSEYGLTFGGTAIASLSGCLIENNGGGVSEGIGLEVYASADVTLTDTTVQKNPHAGLLIGDFGGLNAKLRLEGATAVLDNGNPQNDAAAGLWVTGGQSVIVAPGVTFSGNFGGAIYRDADCEVIVTGATFDSNPEALLLWGSGLARLTDVKVSNSSNADGYAAVELAAGAGSPVAELVDLRIEKCGTTQALKIYDQSRATLSASNGGCLISENAGVGVAVEDGELTMTGCTVSKNLGNGVSASSNATLKATDCTLENNGASPSSDGAGLLADIGAKVTLAGSVPPLGAFSCVVRGNARAGVVVADAGSVSITGCDLRQNAVASAAPRGGLATSGTGTIALLSSRVADNGGPGVSVGGSPSLTITDSQISGNAGVGVLVDVTGASPILLDKAQISANGADPSLSLLERAGVRERSALGNHPLRLLGSVVSSNAGPGLVIDGVGPSVVLLSQSTFDGNKAHGVLVLSAGPTVDLGCDACSTGANLFSNNHADAAVFQDSLADLQDARPAGGPPLTIRNISFDGAPALQSAQTITDPTKLVMLPRRWAFLKEQAGSPVTIFAP